MTPTEADLNRPHVLELHRLIGEEVVTVRAIARAAGCHERAVYRVLEGAVPLRAWLVCVVVSVAPADRRAEVHERLTRASWLGLTVSGKPGSAVPAAVDTRSAALDVGASVGNVLALVRDAEADGVVSPDEHRELEKQLDKVERQAEALREQLRARAGVAS